VTEEDAPPLKKLMAHAFALMNQLDAEFASQGLSGDDVWDFFKHHCKVSSRTELKLAQWEAILSRLKSMVDGDGGTNPVQLDPFCGRVRDHKGVAAPPVPEEQGDQEALPLP